MEVAKRRGRNKLKIMVERIKREEFKEKQRNKLESNKAWRGIELEQQWRLGRAEIRNL